MHDYSLKYVYAFIEIALKIFLIIPITNATCEKIFGKFKIIKKYL